MRSYDISGTDSLSFVNVTMSRQGDVELWNVAEEGACVVGEILASAVMLIAEEQTP